MFMLPLLYDPDDGLCGCWTREQLLEMDARFTAALEAAFQSGLENRALASATFNPTVLVLPATSQWLRGSDRAA